MTRATTSADDRRRKPVLFPDGQASSRHVENPDEREFCSALTGWPLRYLPADVNDQASRLLPSEHKANCK